MQIPQKHSNKSVKGCILLVRDSVLVTNKCLRGKLADRWESTLYMVLASIPNLHIYSIRDRHGTKNVVYCNLLLQVNFLPLPKSRADEAVSFTGDTCPGLLPVADCSQVELMGMPVFCLC